MYAFLVVMTNDDIRPFKEYKVFQSEQDAEKHVFEYNGVKGQTAYYLMVDYEQA